MKKFKSFVSVIAFCVVPGVFGMHEGGQVSNTESVVEGVKSILRCIQTVDANVRRNENVQQVVLLGATGAGKTSLLHALARTKVKAASGDGAARLANRFSLVPAEEAVEAIGRVDGGGRSVTSDIRPCPIGNVLYCDCPGFFDTHGGLREIRNTLLKNKILKRGIKILLVISNDEIVAAKGDAVHSLLSNFGTLLPQERNDEAERKAESVGIVVSKGPETEDTSGMLQIVFGILQERANHHWLIDYLSEHEANSAFWFPAPTTEGEYHAPGYLVNGIRNFATRQAGELITGSMGLGPKVISDLVEYHKYFDVTDEIDKIVDKVSSEYSACKDDLDKLLELEGAFNALWLPLAEKVSGSDNPEGLVERWKRKSSISSNPKKKFNFSLENFVDSLNGIRRFRTICNVEFDGFSSKFEKGIVWEQLVDRISELSDTSEKEINKLRSVRDSWKTKLPGLAREYRHISNEVIKCQQTQTERIVSGVCSGLGAVAGGVVGGLMGAVTGGIGAAPGAAIGTSSGAAAGASVGAVVTKGIHKIQNVFSGRENDD